MNRAKVWFGVLIVAVPFAFAACGDDEDDGGGGDGNGKGGTSGSGGSTGGNATGGKGGSSGTTGTGGKGGTSGASPTGGTSGDAGAGGGDDGGMGGQGGEAGEPQGGTAGISMGGAGGAIAGGGAGGKAGGGAGGAVAGGGAGGKAGGGAGGAVAGGGAGGAMAGGGGTGGAAATCDPNPPPEIYVGVLSGANERPTPVTTTATGFVVAELNAAATELTSTIRWSGLTTDVTNGHIHGPAGVDGTASPIFFYFGMGNPAPNLPPTPSTTGSVVAMTFPIDATQLGYLRTGQLYANIHSVTNGSGEIRGQLVRATVFRSGTMSGGQEVPPVASSATGRGVVAVFPDGIHASVSFTWSGLTSVKTNGHVHGPAAIGMGAAPIFQLLPMAGPTSGSLPHQIWTFAGTDSANLLGNLTYANVHSMDHGTGEIRGQLLPPCPI